MRDRASGGAAGTWLVIAVIGGALISAAVMRLRSVEVGRGVPLPDMRLDINAATAPQLNLVPGIGPRLAERIVDDRAQHGPFRSVDDLQRVPGIGPVIVSSVHEFAVCEPTPASVP